MTVFADRCLVCGWTPAHEDHECVMTAEPLGIGPGGHSWDDLARLSGLRVWEYPDDNPFPTLVLFPRIARLGVRLRRIREVGE